MAAYTASDSSSSREENIPLTFSKPKRRVRKQCYMHLISVKREREEDFTLTRWNTYRGAITKWLGLDGETRALAEIYQHCRDIKFKNIPEDAAFHPTCYRRFIDKRRMEIAGRRVAREDTKNTVTLLDAPLDGPGSTHAPRKLGSKTGLPTPCSGRVLPALCIICKKTEKHVTVRGKRQKAHLAQAKTSSAGQLQKAAELKQDDSILMHIKDKDCVSLEVRYHRCCYERYTSFLKKYTPPDKQQNERTFDISYKIFYERIVRQRILVNKEVLRMNQLRRTFCNLVKTHEGLDASNYRQDALKRRLAHDFPQLVFHAPTKRNICELVFAETLSSDELIHSLPLPSVTETTTEVSQTDSDDENTSGATEGRKTPEDKRTLYTAALFLKRLLSDSPGMSCSWPPTSEDLNSTIAKSVVPHELYNLVSLIVGATEETSVDRYVDIEDDLNLKVLSICQDIVHVASKGRKQTP